MDLFFVVAHCNNIPAKNELKIKWTHENFEWHNFVTLTYWHHLLRRPKKGLFKDSQNVMDFFTMFKNFVVPNNSKWRIIEIAFQRQNLTGRTWSTVYCLCNEGCSHDYQQQQQVETISAVHRVHDTRILEEHVTVILLTQALNFASPVMKKFKIKSKLFSKRKIESSWEKTL